MMGGMGIKCGWTTECGDFHIIACTGVGVYRVKGEYYKHTFIFTGPHNESFLLASLPPLLLEAGLGESFRQ